MLTNLMTHIKIERDGPVLRVSLARAEKANALNIAMRLELIRQFRAAAQDQELRALILTGEGGRAFCAGADLAEVNGMDDGSWDDMSDALQSLPVLSVAVIAGHCIGGGLSLALGCDIRVATPQSRFSYPVLKNGVMPGRTDSARLQQLVGPGRMSAILLGGVRLDADEALGWGMVDRLADVDGMNAAVREICAAACGAHRAHLVALKHICRETER